MDWDSRTSSGYYGAMYKEETYGKHELDVVQGTMIIIIVAVACWVTWSFAGC